MKHVPLILYFFLNLITFTQILHLYLKHHFSFKTSLSLKSLILLNYRISVFSEIYCIFLEPVRTPSTISDVNDGEEAKINSELSIPEDLASTGETISDEIEEDISKKTANTAMKDISEKTPSEYTNCTFESDDTTPSKPPTLAQTSTLKTEAHVEDDHSSLTGKNNIERGGGGGVSLNPRGYINT